MVPAPGSYPPFTQTYISLVEVGSVAEAADNYSESILYFFKNIPETKVSYRYAEGKWSIKEMLQHIIDTERILAYRALRIARHDKTPLPGFDENGFASAANGDERTWQSLLTEFSVVRLSSDLLIKNFSENQLLQSGITSGHTNTTLAICYTIYGHILHHINILKERYL